MVSLSPDPLPLTPLPGTLLYPDTLFVARGSASTVEKGDVIPVLETVVPNVRVWRLIDRDDMPDPTRDQKIIEGIRVLRRREIENYLWDKAVVHKALQNMGATDSAIESILEEYPFPSPKQDDMKTDNQQQVFFEKIRRAEGVSLPGRNRMEFAFAYLAQALRETEGVYQKLQENVFPADTSSGPHHQDSGEAKIRESTAGVSRKPSSDCKACECSSKHLCGLTAWNT